MGLLDPPGITPAAAAAQFAPAGSVPAAYQQYVSSLVVTNSSLAAIAAESGYVWALVDANGAVALGVTPAGKVIGNIALAAGSLSVAAFDAVTQTRLTGVDVGSFMQAITPEQAGYLYAITGSTGRIAFGIQPDGSVSIPKLLLGSGVVDYAQLSATVNSALAQTAPTESGYAWSVVDSSGRIALGVQPDGTVLVSKFVPPAGSVSYASLNAQLASALMASIYTESGYAWAVTDAAGRVALGVQTDGTVYMAKSTLPSYSLRASESANYVAQPFRDGAGRYQIRVIRKSDSAALLSTSGAYNSVEPKISTDETKLLYSNDSTGTMTATWQPIGGGTSWLLTPSPDILCPGDSLTAGAGAASGANTYPSVLAGALGTTAFNYGVGGQGSASIAARANGTPALCTVTGNQIPASGTVALTAISVRIYGAASALGGAGTLAGIPGTLTDDGAGNYTFTRTTAGSATACPANTPFYADVATTRQQSTLSLWMGRNDISNLTPSQVVAYVQSVIDYSKPFLKRYVVLSIPPSTSDTIGTSTRTNLDAINALLSSTYGTNYLDVSGYLRSAQAFTDAALTPTTQDTTDMTNSITPTSFRADGIHLNDISYPLVGRYVAAAMRAKGWYS